MLSPFATARCSTSSVAIIVTATPVTGVLGSPVLNVSTVFSRHSTPTCPLIASTPPCAVTFFPASCPDAVATIAIANAITPTISLIRISVGHGTAVPSSSKKQRQAKSCHSERSEESALMPCPKLHDKQPNFDHSKQTCHSDRSAEAFTPVNASARSVEKPLFHPNDVQSPTPKPRYFTTPPALSM